MGMVQNDLQLIGATQFAVGLSQVIRVSPSAFQYAGTLQWLSGGTLELVPPQFSGISSQAGNAWGKGKQISTTESYAISGPATFYLAATGATVTAMMTLGYTSGASIL